MGDVSAELRRVVEGRAEGRCEYCRTPVQTGFAAHEIDHIIAIKHGGATELGNLALACWVCNRHKGTDIASIDPQTGLLAELFHPRRDTWAEHFVLAGRKVLGISATGRSTTALLRFNWRSEIRRRPIKPRVV